MTDTPNKSSASYQIDEAQELLGRYSGPVDGTWERNMESIALLMVIHLKQMDRRMSYYGLMREAAIFCRAIFRMGRDSVDTMEETNNES